MAYTIYYSDVGPLPLILGTECIGDSLPKINGNYVSLSGTCVKLITQIYDMSATQEARNRTGIIYINYGAQLSAFEIPRAMSVFTTVSALSSNWNSAYTNIGPASNNLTTLRQLSSQWMLATSTVSSTSSVYTAMRNNSASYTFAFESLTAYSPFWSLGSQYAIDGKFLWDNTTSFYRGVSASYARTEVNLANAIGVFTPTTSLTSNSISVYTTTRTNSAAWSMANSSITPATNNPLLSGWTTLPSGLIIQWGRVSGIITTHGVSAVRFPRTFPNAVLNITTSRVQNAAATGDGQSGPCSIRSDFTTAGFTLIQDISGGLLAVNEMWTALGF